MNRMHNKKIKYIFFSAIALLLFGTTVAFAALSTKLIIGGTINRYGGTWNIYFSNVSASSNTTNVESYSANISKTNPTTLNVSCSFTEGSNGIADFDAITYIITVKNDGSLDAKLASWNISDVETGSEITTNIGIVGLLRYADGSSLNVGDILKSGESVNLEFELRSLGNIDIEEDTFFDFSVSVQYVQT